MSQHSDSFTSPKQQCKPVYHLHTLLAPKGTRWLLGCRDGCSPLKIGGPGKLMQLMTTKETCLWKWKHWRITTFQIFHPNRLSQQSHESELQTKQQHCEQAKHEQNFLCWEPCLSCYSRAEFSKISWPGFHLFFPLFYILDQVLFVTLNTHILVYKRSFPHSLKKVKKIQWENLSRNAWEICQYLIYGVLWHDN